MKSLFTFNLVLLLCVDNIQWIKARQKIVVLDGDELTKKIYDSQKSIFYPEIKKFDKLDLILNGCHINSISKVSFGNLTFKKINLERNNIKKIDSDSFSNFEYLMEVDLRRNNIEIIPKELFQHNIRIKYIFLSVNRIAEIEEKAFDNLIELQQLDLNSNPLKQLDGEIFSNNRQLHTLDLSKTELKQLNDSLLQNLPAMTFLDLNANEIVNISEYLFKNNNKLQSLNLEGNKIVNVAKGAFQQLYAVTTLHFTANNISELNEDFFCNMTRLSKLYLSNNKIKTLGPNLFSKNTQLVYLETNNNSITSLPWGLFKYNRRLEKLSLEKNQLTQITNENFEMNGNLTHLSLARNKISLLDAAAFDGLHKLVYLDLQFNEIEDLPNKIFHKVSETLEVLLLNNNKMKVIHKDMFSVGMRLLYNLNLGHNYLTNCHFYNHKYFLKLRDLHLNNNKFQRIEIIFTRSNGKENQTLQNLYLEFNEIEFSEYLNSLYVRTFENLKFLNMSNNKITYLKIHNYYVEFLDIIFDFRNNRIMQLEIAFFIEIDMISRGYLYLWESVIPVKNMNEMRSVDFYTYDKVLKIKKYDLTVSAVKKAIEEIECEDDLIIVSLVIHENHLKQIDCLSNVWTLHFIDFSYNDLTNLTKAQFSKMIYLETLNISHNPLTSLDLKIFAASVKLTEFYFDECEVVYSWQYYQITEMFPNLTHISMQNNSIYCPLLSTIIQKFQKSNITIKDYKKTEKIVFDSVHGISCEDYKSIKDILILVVCSNNFLIVTIIMIVLSIVHRYNKMYI